MSQVWYRSSWSPNSVLNVPIPSILCIPSSLQAIPSHRNTPPASAQDTHRSPPCDPRTGDTETTEAENQSTLWGTNWGSWQSLDASSFAWDWRQNADLWWSMHFHVVRPGFVCSGCLEFLLFATLKWDIVQHDQTRIQVTSFISKCPTAVNTGFYPFYLLGAAILHIGFNLPGCVVSVDSQ